MRQFLILFFAIALCVTACGPKPYYKTAKGKKKQKYYNTLQYGGGTQEAKRPK